MPVRYRKGCCPQADHRRPGSQARQQPVDRVGVTPIGRIEIEPLCPQPSRLGSATVGWPRQSSVRRCAALASEGQRGARRSATSAAVPTLELRTVHTASEPAADRPKPYDEPMAAPPACLTSRSLFATISAGLWRSGGKLFVETSRDHRPHRRARQRRGHQAGTSPRRSSTSSRWRAPRPAKPCVPLRRPSALPTRAGRTARSRPNALRREHVGRSRVGLGFPTASSRKPWRPTCPDVWGKLAPINVQTAVLTASFQVSVSHELRDVTRPRCMPRAA